MLLIWDIHITSRYQDRILQEITNFINKYPEEKNIIFLWDYVYHFSYDRKAILALYTLFIQLFESGKNIYVLAGNHDRLGNSFVFEEAQKAFDIIDRIFEGNKWKIKFITTPLRENIENKEVLFLPHFLESNQNMENQKQSSKNELYSQKIDQILKENSQKWLLVIHHHYFDNVSFPWQKAKFSYKDVAIDSKYLDDTNLKFISWHLHQSFTYKNYFCTWSIRNTSPLEENQIKVLCKYDTDADTITCEEITINPYISLHLESEVLSEDKLKEEINNIKNLNQKLISDSPSWKVSIDYNEIKLNEISLVIKSENMNYENFKEQITDEITNKVKDIRIKKAVKNIEELEQKLDLSGRNLATGFWDRKQLLKDYLRYKYPSNFTEYEEMLKKLKLFQ